MKFIKCNYFLFFILLTSIFSSACLKDEHGNIMPFCADLFDGFDVYNPDGTYNYDIFADFSEYRVDRAERTISPADIVTLLIQQADILEILQEPFYLHTNQLNKRNLLDRPLFGNNRSTWIPCHDTCQFSYKKDGGLIGIHLFTVIMDRNNYTKRSTNLCSYLALQEPTLINKLENVVDRLRPLFANQSFNLDINKIFCLFKNMAVQQRQGGFYFQFGKLWDRCRLTFQFPLYYQERNFSLTPDERRLVENEFGKADPAEQEDFQKHHLISDKIGFGDSRLQFDMFICDKPTSFLFLGFYTTLPTAFSLINGIMGTVFPKPCNFPSFSFEELFNLAIQAGNSENQQKAFDMISDLLLGALDRLAANLLDAPLGNGGHLGLATYLTAQVPLGRWINTSWAACTMIESHISLEYLTPRFEKRFFINKINPADFDPSKFIDPDNPPIDPVEAAANLAFLEEAFVDRLYTRAFSVMIHTRPIFRYITKIFYNGPTWIFSLGSDTWVQGADGISHIRNRAIQEEVCFYKVIPSIAYQGSVFANITYKHDCPDYSWLFSVDLTSTVITRGIGHDWGLALRAEKFF